MNQITPKHPSATERVRQALASGAHQIRADDVREQLIEQQRQMTLAIETERELCARICDALHHNWHFGEESGPRECAAGIRART